jgi:ComF family protein
VVLSPVAVCETCLAGVGSGADHAIQCTRCGDALAPESARFAAAMGVTECTLCRLAPPEFSKAVAFADYDAEMRELLHLLKFAGQRRIAEHLLGARLATAILRLLPHTADDLLVLPVPIFAARRHERGFNQAELLASAALRRLRHTAPAWHLTLRADILLRVKDTRAFYRLDPAQRRRDLVGAFQIAPAQAAALQGREVLLIDDILTTGATARACARVLLRAGAAKVWVATVAKAQPELTVQQQSGVALWTAAARTRVIEPDIGRQKSF